MLLLLDVVVQIYFVHLVLNPICCYARLYVNGLAWLETGHSVRFSVVDFSVLLRCCELCVMLFMIFHCARQLSAKNTCIDEIEESAQSCPQLMQSRTEIAGSV